MFGPLGDVGNYFHAVDVLLDLALGDKYIERHVLVVGNNKAEILTHLQYSGIGCFFTFQNFFYLPFFFMAFAPGKEQHFHMVTMQRTVYVVGCNKNIFTAFVGCDIGFAGFFHIHDAGNIFLRKSCICRTRRVQHVFAGFYFLKFTGKMQLFQDIENEVLAGLVVQAQLARNLFVVICSERILGKIAENNSRQCSFWPAVFFMFFPHDLIRYCVLFVFFQLLNF